MMVSSNDIRVFIGSDSTETVTSFVLAYSIWRRTRQTVYITPLTGKPDVLTRPRHPLQSNDFSFSRFLVPWLCQYEGWALFMDCDMLCRADLDELWGLRSLRYAVQVVKHDYQPATQIKYLGKIQSAYTKKNWSSVMLFNCALCKQLTPEYVNEASGLDLHQFKWTMENKVGELPAKWNHLVGYYPYNANAAVVHFTDGGPYFADYRNVPYASEWWADYHDMLHVSQLSPPPWYVGENK